MHLCMPSRHISRLAETRIIIESLMACFFSSELPQTESSSNPRAMLDLSCHPRPPPKSLPAQRGTHFPRSSRRPRNPWADDELMKIGRDSLPMTSPKYRQQHSVKHCTHFRRGLNSVSLLSVRTCM